MKLILVAALAAAAGAAQAQTLNSPQVYGSVGYAEKKESDLGAIQLRLAARFGRHLGLEGEFANGVKSRTDNALHTQAPSTVKTTLRHEIAAYAVGYLPLSPKAELFARVGYGQTWYGVDSRSATTALRYKHDDTSFNLGAGGQYFFDEKNGVRFDYVRQDYNNGDVQDVWAVAYTRRF